MLVLGYFNQNEYFLLLLFLGEELPFFIRCFFVKELREQFFYHYSKELIDEVL